VVEAVSKAVGDYWSGRRHSSANWWTNRLVVRDVNRRICGEPLRNLSDGAHALGRRLVQDRPRRLGISVGCGIGVKEIALLRSGFVERMRAFDLAADRITQARAAATAAGVADRIEFIVGDAFSAGAENAFDLVYWNNALHHMFDATAAVRWSRDVLAPDGLLLIDEFVGPTRLDFEAETLDFANGIRALLPDRLLAHATAGTFHPRRLGREFFAPVLAKDPSEAADSARILPALREVFDGAVVRPAGGVIYYLALNGLYGNLDMADTGDRELLAALLRLDELHAAARPDDTLYAVAAARR
jgi:SAM-dependent methyltransferase